MFIEFKLDRAGKLNVLVLGPGRTKTLLSSSPAGTSADGWKPGPPPHIMPIVAEADFLTYANAGCRKCKRRGCLQLRPEHRGRQYRIAGTCRKCGTEHSF